MDRTVSAVAASLESYSADGDTQYDGITLSADPLPLHFEFHDESAENYMLRIHGLELFTIMEPYGIAFLKGSCIHYQQNKASSLPS